MLFPFRILARADPPSDETSEHLVHLRKEVEDLRMNLILNKESLTVMLAELQLKDSKEKSLIETINIISQENASLKL